MPNRLVVTAGTSFVTAPNDVYVGKSLEVYGEWSYGEIQLLAQILRPDSNVVEAGANIGAHTVFLGRDICPNGRIYAYEPRRLTFQLLCANLALNSISNVHAFQQGLGAAPELILEGPLPHHPSNLGAFPLGTLPGDGERIVVAPLDAQLDTLRHISLLKADVEGHELQVLKGAERLIGRDRPILYLENDRPEISEPLISHVMALGYALWWHVVPLFRPENAAGTQQNIFADIHSFNMLCLPHEAGLNVQGLPTITDPAAHPLQGR